MELPCCKRPTPLHPSPSSCVTGTNAPNSSRMPATKTFFTSLRFKASPSADLQWRLRRSSARFGTAVPFTENSRRPRRRASPKCNPPMNQCRSTLLVQVYTRPPSPCQCSLRVSSDLTPVLRICRQRRFCKSQKAKEPCLHQHVKGARGNFAALALTFKSDATSHCQHAPQL